MSPYSFLQRMPILIVRHVETAQFLGAHIPLIFAGQDERFIGLTAQASLGRGWAGHADIETEGGPPLVWKAAQAGR